MASPEVVQVSAAETGRQATFRTNLHFGADAVGDLVLLLSSGGVRLGQQTRVRQRTVLWLHKLEEKERS